MGKYRAKIWLSDDVYMYPHGRTVRQKLAPRRGCVGYRVKEVKPGRKILLCLLPSGKTKAVSLMRDVGMDLRSASKEARKIVKTARRILGVKRGE